MKEYWDKFATWWKLGESKHGNLWVFGTLVVVLIVLAVLFGG